VLDLRLPDIPNLVIGSRPVNQSSITSTSSFVVILADVDAIVSTLCCVALAGLVLSRSCSIFVVRNCIMFL